MSTHLVNPHKHRELCSDNTLHVVGFIQNAARWHSRYRVFREWVREMLQTPHVKLYVVELVHGDRHAECAPVCDEYGYLKLHTDSEIWAKENGLNLGIKHLLPRDWKYVCWSDCDISFANPSWAQETLHQLQHYPILQPWSDAIDLSFDGGVLQHFRSIGYYSAKHMKHAPSAKNPYCLPYGHVGFCWAATRPWYENVEKLLDFAVLGAGDNHIAWSCLGDVKGTYNPAISEGYKAACLAYQERARRASQGIIGYTPGRITHHFHGSKRRRGYWDRWQILVKFKYDPLKDLRYTKEGVIHLRGKHKLEHAIRLYNRNRREDSIDND